MYIELSKEFEQELINFYLVPHTIAETMKKYNIGREKIKNILKAYSIPEHSKEIVNTIKQNNFTSEQVQEIIKFYLIPNTLQDTAEKFNLGRFALKNLLKRNNVVEHPRETLELLKFNKLINGREQEIIEFYLQPNSIEKTAIAFNLGRPAVISLLSKNNIEIRNDYKIIFTKEQEKEIINYYLMPNSLNETCRQFNIKNKNIIKNVLVKNNIKFHSKEVCMQLKQEKATKTNLERYGVTNTYQLPEIKEKAQRVWKENEAEIHEKMQKTCLERYGDPFYHNQEQANKTRLEKYGVENFFQIKEIHEKAIQNNRFTPNKYFYQNEFFDSFPELCFYLYHIINHIEIIREPIELNYEFEGKLYHYYPDFKVGDSIYEIKGDQFLAEDGSWCNPFKHSQDELFKAKYICAVENNIKILYEKDYIKYINWFYESDYKKEDFKFNKNKS